MEFPIWTGSHSQTSSARPVARADDRLMLNDVFGCFAPAETSETCLLATMFKALLCIVTLGLNVRFWPVSACREGLHPTHCCLSRIEANINHESAMDRLLAK